MGVILLLASEENALGLLLTQMKRWYWHAGDREPIGHILDAFEALGFVTRQGQKPLLTHKHKTPAGWRLEFCLPPGISSKDVLAKLDHFQEQAAAQIEVTVTGRILHMEVLVNPMPLHIPFAFEQPEKTALAIPIGYTHAREMVLADLPDLPHLLVAGNTGSGKTTFLRGVAVASILRGAQVCVIDLKGLDFHHLSRHALVVDTDQSALALLAALNRELDRRKETLKQAGATKLQDYEGLPWVVVIIDELAELQAREAQDALNRLARLSRAVGICLVVSTQRPSHTLFHRFTDTRMLFAARLCFSVPRPEDSRLVLDSDRAAGLPPIPGRAVWRWNKEAEVQCMELSAKDAQKMLAGTPEVRTIEPCTRRLPPR